MNNSSNPVHLFLIHSHASFLCSESLVRHLALNHEDCVFIFLRGYDWPNGYEHVRDIISYPLPEHKFTDYYCLRHPEIARGNVEDIDTLINFATEERPFILYTPGTWVYTITLIASHPKCIRYNIIEDGLYTYMWECVHDEIRSLPRYDEKAMKACNDNRLLYFDRSVICVDHPKFGTAYSLCKGAYPGVKRAVVVPDAFRKIELPGYEKMDASIAFCTTMQYLKTDYDLFIEMIRKLIEIEFVPRKYRNVSFKYRKCDIDPNVEKACLRIFRQYEGRIAFHEIPDNVIMENLIYSYDCPVYFLATTLGFYAAKMGRESRSYYHLYAQIDPDFARKYHNTPSRPEWRETIQLLQDSGTTFMRLPKSQPRSWASAVRSAVRRLFVGSAKFALKPVVSVARRVAAVALREEFGRLQELKKETVSNMTKVTELSKRVKTLVNEA